MSDGSPLKQLSSICGISDSYRDAWENTIMTSQETHRSLLDAMGFPCDSEQAISDSLERVRHRLTAQMAPRMVVLHKGRTIRIPLRIPSEHVQRSLAFTLVSETGEILTGSTSLARYETQVFGLDPHWITLSPTLAMPALPCGYHKLLLEISGTPLRSETTLAITPARCHLPEDPERQRIGLAVQLYGLRHDNDWGVGDFNTLANMLALSGREGYDFMGIGPVHAQFPADPNHFSPYDPSSRNLLDIAHISILDIPEFADCPEARDICATSTFQATLTAIRWEPLVNYPAVSMLKMQALEALWQHFTRTQIANATARAEAFARFCTQNREKLEQHATFEALHEHFYLSDSWKWNWQTWPLEYRNPESHHVQEFVHQHRNRVDFFMWLQWLAHEQLMSARKSAEDTGMSPGLYGDFAVGLSPGGSVAWSQQESVPTRACLGAPPDKLCPFGQSWGLSAFTPFGLMESGYAPFISAMRENMRYFGALRMDHVMGLSRLFWVPQGHTAANGAYIAYPAASLIGLIALESQRAKCMVVGEDLGTVETSFRKELEQAGILSCRVLMLERSKAGRVPGASKWKTQAIASLTTHDLATCKGFWQEHDISWNNIAGKLGDAATEKTLRRIRRKDKWALLLALAREGLLPEGKTPRQLLAEYDANLPVLLHAFLARTPALAHIISIEDILGLVEQPNLPGTFDEHPNWRRRLPMTIANLSDSGKLSAFRNALLAHAGKEEKPLG
ncbi:MAG: 4-alpha-glucanotransferase [Alphaproteobacteria bacterium GWF2_58_20]|nr:MAG: 4-alpha-glucanotransferase [Alphaproteobacteria bacterium GWF2_58_20]